MTEYRWTFHKAAPFAYGPTVDVGPATDVLAAKSLFCEIYGVWPAEPVKSTLYLKG